MLHFRTAAEHHVRLGNVQVGAGWLSTDLAPGSGTLLEQGQIILLQTTKILVQQLSLSIFNKKVFSSSV